MATTLIFFDRCWYRYIFLAGAFIIGRLLVDHGISKVGRILGCCMDIGGATLVLYLNGNLAAPLFVVCFWVNDLKWKKN